ncbi:hypothetical protein D3C77_367560 [compost metagenome]
MIDDALQIAAEEIMPFRLSAPRKDIVRVEARIAFSEAFRENLIEHRVLYPFRHREYIGGIDVWVIEEPIRDCRTLLRELALRHPNFLIPRLQQETVFQAAIRGLDDACPVIEQFVGGHFGHRNQFLALIPYVFVASKGINMGKVIFFGPQAQVDRIAIIGVGPV